MKAISYIAILTNVVLLIQTTQFVPRLMYAFYGYDDGQTFLDFSLPEVNISTWHTHQEEHGHSGKTKHGSDVASCRVGFEYYNEHLSTDVTAINDWGKLRQHIALWGLVIGFVFSVFIEYGVSDIPTKQNNILLKENRLAQKALRQYLFQGQGRNSID